MAKVKGNYLDLGYDVNDFKAGATIAVEFQLILRNFKTSKKINVIKVYLFRLLGVYLMDNPVLSTMSMPEKQNQKDNKWMIISLKTKKTITSINSLEC